MNSPANEIVNPAPRGERLVIGGILLLAAALRFHDLELVSVTNETAYQQLTAATALAFEQGQWPLAGPPTDEVRGSSFLVSAIAASNLIRWHPFSGYVLVIVLNLAAIWILFRMCRRHFGRPVAFSAALLHAVAPWSVLAARVPLPSSCLAVFVVCLISLSLNWLQEGGGQKLFAMVVLSFAIPQIHFTGIWVPLWLLTVLILGRAKWNSLALAAGIMVGILLWFPWLEFQRITEWSELKSWAAQVPGAPRAHLTTLLHSLDHLQAMLHTGRMDDWFGAGKSSRTDYFPSWQQWGARLGAVVLVGLLIGAVAVIVQQGSRRGRLLLLWIGLSVLCGAVLRTGSRPENLLIAYPVPFVLIGLAVSRLRENLPGRLGGIPPLVFSLVAVLLLANLSGWANYVSDDQTLGTGRYELSYRQRREVIESIVEHAGADPVKLVGSYSGWYPAYEYVLMYEAPQALPRAGQAPQDLTCYWIDEQARPVDQERNQWLNLKERRINLSIAEHLMTSPDWVIAEEWAVGPARIYKLHFERKKAFQ
jgi:hypothetical protein